MEFPNKSMLFLPANSSSTGLQELLQNNQERGILFETEADTLNIILKQDFGDYSDVLRKAFHLESIVYYRRGNKEYKSISEPKLSVIISGTPNQLTKLIPSAENGLFSRFIIYLFEQEL